MATTVSVHEIHDTWRMFPLFTRQTRSSSGRALIDWSGRNRQWRRPPSAGSGNRSAARGTP